MAEKTEFKTVETSQEDLEELEVPIGNGKSAGSVILDTWFRALSHKTIQRPRVRAVATTSLLCLFRNLGRTQE